jgi:hypothetical protein
VVWDVTPGYTYQDEWRYRIAIAKTCRRIAERQKREGKKQG